MTLTVNESDFKESFSVVPEATSFWRWELDKSGTPKLFLVDANKACGNVFRKRKLSACINRNATEIMPSLMVDEFLAPLKQVIESGEEAELALPSSSTLNATLVRIVPCADHVLILYFSKVEADAPVATSTSTSSSSSSSSSHPPASPSTPPAAGFVTPERSSSSSLATPSTPQDTLRNLFRDSPLKSVRVQARPQSPRTSIHAARKQFEIIEKGTPLDNPRRDLGEILPALVTENNNDAVEHALAHGADPNGDKGMFTPLYAAVRLGQYEICEKLLSEGASMSKCNDGTYQSPLEAVVSLDPNSPIYQLFTRHVEFGEQLLAVQKQGILHSTTIDEPSSKKVRRAD